MHVYLISAPTNCEILFFFLKWIHRNTVFYKDTCHISDKNLILKSLRPKIHRWIVKNVFSLKNVGLTKQCYTEQSDCTTQNSETLLQTAMLCPTVYLKNVVPHNSEMCVTEIGFSKTKEFYLHYIPRNRMQWKLGLGRWIHQTVLWDPKTCFSAFLE
jgi:hypothetical protein